MVRPWHYGMGIQDGKDQGQTNWAKSAKLHQPNYKIFKP